jgi:phosphonate transport system substrate-binding protein
VGPGRRRPGLAGGRRPRRAQDGGVYRFSPVNQYGINLTAAYWNPIIAYVSEKSGVKLQLKIGRTSADTTAYVLAQEVEFVFSNHLFSPEREKLGWKVFGRRMTPRCTARSWCRRTRRSPSWPSCRARTSPFPAPRPWWPTSSRRPAGGAQIEAKTVFGGNMDAAFAQLFSGKVAAVGTNSQLAEGYAARRQEARAVVLAAATTWP